MKFKTLAVAAFAFLGCAGLAAAQQTVNTTHVHTIFMANASEDGVTKTVDKNGVVHSTVSVPVRAVRLNEDVSIGNIGSGFNLKEGDILFGRYDNSVWTYCAFGNLNTESRVASAVLLGVLTAGTSLLLEAAGRPTEINCFHDQNDDGKFDTAWSGGIAEGETTQVAFTLNKKAMEARPAYERVDPKLGPQMPVTITWWKVKNQAAIQFKLNVGESRVSQKTVNIPSAGEDPVEVSLGLAKFKLNSFTPETETQDGRIEVTIDTGFKQRYTRIRARQVITTTYTYY